jgi:hypothetical protein
MFSWMGCPGPANHSGYEGPWLVMFDWDCNSMGGEGIFTLRADGTLDMRDLSLDDNKDTAVAYGPGGEIDPLEWLAAQNGAGSPEKYRFEGDWHIDETTGQLVMVVHGFNEVRYYVTRQYGNVHFGDMYVGDFFVGCFQMQPER